jgi:hypothetical protein
MEAWELLNKSLLEILMVIEKYQSEVKHESQNSAR